MALKVHLITERMTADDNRLRPSGYDARNVLTDDGLAEHCPAQDVPDGAVWTQPHLLQLILFDTKVGTFPFTVTVNRCIPGLIGSDGGALDAHVVLLDGFGSIDGHLVVGLIAVGQSQIVVLDVDVQVREDQLKTVCFNMPSATKYTLFLISAQMIRVISSPANDICIIPRRTERTYRQDLQPGLRRESSCAGSAQRWRCRGTPAAHRGPG